jgi:hypothetical protein
MTTPSTHGSIRGDLSSISGGLSSISGGLSSISGDLSSISGGLSSISGDLTLKSFLRYTEEDGRGAGSPGLPAATLPRRHTP